MLFLYSRRLSNVLLGPGLLFPHGEISTPHVQEFLMRAPFYNLPLMDHDNLI
jgi:hypothetical protein